MVLLAAFAATLFAIPAPAQGSVAFPMPPNDIYTCDWIAAHPAAAIQAAVTCDPSVFFAASESLALATAPGAGPDANGCQPVPNNGSRVGQGVFAWSTYEYANDWVFYGNYSPADYTYYIQKTDGTNVVQQRITDVIAHEIGVQANIYRWGAQNHSSTAQSWEVCYDVK